MLEYLINYTIILDIINQAKIAYPKEMAGLLIGKNKNLIDLFLPVENSAKDNSTFIFEPNSYLKQLKFIEKNNYNLIGIIHSHPQGSPYPSTTDIEHWYYPELSYWIISMQNFEPKINAFSIKGKKVQKIDFQIINFPENELIKN